MDIQELKYFLSVAQTHSFSEASEICNISQSSLSKAIMRLEHELNVKLFNRSHHPVDLTNAGEYFYRQLKPLERPFLGAVEGLRQYQKSVVLRCMLCPNAFYYRDACAEFQLTHPSIAIEMSYVSSIQDAVRRVQTEQVDCCLSVRPFQVPSDIRVHEMLNDELLVLVSKRHPLAEENVVSLQALSAYTAIQSGFTKQILFQLMEYFQFRPQNVYPTGDAVIQRHEAIRRITLGKGIGFFCSRELAGFNLSGATPLRLQEVGELPVVLMELQSQPDTAEKRTFRTWMQQNLARFAYPMLDECSG